jgi:hypothetical protein
MATAPTSRKLNLTRDQLAAFLTDQQQIRQFELLFSTVDQLQVITATDFEFQADNAAAAANEALAQISRLAQSLELLALAPRLEIGTIASQNANAVAITGGVINGTAIGGTTPAAGTFTTLIGGKDKVNYGQLTGGATTNAVEFKTLGTDTNVALAIRTQGTGAIDLAAGSRGVNISNGGTVTAITRTAGGAGYTVAPTVTISAPTTSGGVQATATCTVTAGVVNTTFTITNAGSGYIEQPTITFTPVSGGAGAAAYATVGGTPTVKSIGSAISFATPSGEQFRVRDNTTTAVNYGTIKGSASGSTVDFGVDGTDGSITLALKSKAAGGISLYTGGGNNLQFAVPHTASAVNYVQITGGTTATKIVTISAQGSDTDVDLALTPKGTGRVRFGTYTAVVTAVAGYIEVKDSGGTLRKLAVLT